MTEPPVLTAAGQGVLRVRDPGHLRHHVRGGRGDHQRQAQVPGKLITRYIVHRYIYYLPLYNCPLHLGG